MTTAPGPGAGTEELAGVAEAADGATAEDLVAEPAFEEPEPQPVAEAKPDCRLLFAGVEVELPDTNPVVVLQEADVPYRKLRITIGSPEGVAIAYAWREIATPRPLTHELFAEVLRAFAITLDVVRITSVRGTSFTAELVLGGRPGQRVVPCRPSDAIALALRQQIAVPIMAAWEVMEEAATGHP